MNDIILKDEQGNDVTYSNVSSVNLLNTSGSTTTFILPATVDVSKTDDVTTINITDSKGTETVELRDGKTPVKGVDYWTDADKNELNQLLINKADTLRTKSGNSIIIDDSENAPIHRLKLFGRDEVIGTPSPENPAEIRSLGPYGNTTHTVNNDGKLVVAMRQIGSFNYDRYFDPYVGKVSYEMLYSLNLNGCKEVDPNIFVVRGIDHSGNAVSVLNVKLYLSADGITFGTYDAGGENPISTPFEEGRTYKVRADIDPEAGTYNLYVDDQVVITGRHLRCSVFELNGIRLTIHRSGGNSVPVAYYDDIVVRSEFIQLMKDTFDSLSGWTAPSPSSLSNASFDDSGRLEVCLHPGRLSSVQFKNNTVFDGSKKTFVSFDLMIDGDSSSNFEASLLLRGTSTAVNVGVKSGAVSAQYGNTSASFEHGVYHKLTIVTDTPNKKLDVYLDRVKVYSSSAGYLNGQTSWNSLVFDVKGNNSSKSCFATFDNLVIFQDNGSTQNIVFTENFSDKSLSGWTGGSVGNVISAPKHGSLDVIVTDTVSDHPVLYSNDFITEQGGMLALTSGTKECALGTAYEGKITVEYKIKMVPQGTSFKAKAFFKGSNNVTFANVGFKDGVIDLCGTLISGSSYTANEWHTVKVVADPNTQTYDMYLNNILLNEGRSYEGTVSDILKIYFQIESGTGAAYFDDLRVVSGDAQTLAISIPGGLPGIPVSDNGNYTDTNGQQWISDVVDSNGLYEKILYTKIFDGTEDLQSYSSVTNGVRFYPDPFVAYLDGARPCICSHFTSYSGSWSNQPDKSVQVFDPNYIVFRYDNCPTPDTLKEYFAQQYANGTPVIVQYVRADSEKILTSSTSKVVYTSSSGNTVFNNVDTWMDIAYYTPTTGVQMTYSTGNSGEVLSIDSKGRVVPKDITGKIKEQLKNVDFPVDSVNGKTGHVKLTASDVSAVPTYRTINKKPLSSNITLTALDVGAAPEGFGLGDYCTSIYSWDLAVKSGFYRSLNGGPTSGEWYGIVVARSSTTFTQYVFNDLGHSAQRLYCYGMGPWEWNNPPLELGVEYRTTKRFNGKPVYVKLDSFGPLPDMETGSIEHGISNLDFVVHLDIYFSKVTNNPNAFDVGSIWTNYDYIEAVWATPEMVHITTKDLMSNAQVLYLMEYTKD